MPNTFLRLAFSQLGFEDEVHLSRQVIIPNLFICLRAMRLGRTQVATML